MTEELRTFLRPEADAELMDSDDRSPTNLYMNHDDIWDMDLAAEN